MPENTSLEPAVHPKPQEAASDNQLIQIWLHGRSRHTQRAYAADVLRLLSHTGRTLASLTLSDLQSFADRLAGTLSLASVYRILSATKSLLAFGHRIGYLPFDVGRALRLPTVRNSLSERILPETRVHQMIGFEPTLRNRVVLLLLYASGARVSELCNLCWRDVHTSDNGVYITLFGKGGKTRTVKLPRSVGDALNELRGAACPNDPLFRSRKAGASLKPGAVLHIVRQAAKRAGVSEPVSPHWLRHAHASHALDRGAPIHLVQATLGHAAISTTGRYLHARPQESSSSFLPL